jgi:hypothetical protein
MEMGYKLTKYPPSHLILHTLGVLPSLLLTFDFDFDISSGNRVNSIVTQLQSQFQSQSLRSPIVHRGRHPSTVAAVVVEYHINPKPE